MHAFVPQTCLSQSICPKSSRHKGLHLLNRFLVAMEESQGMAFTKLWCGLCSTRAIECALAVHRLYGSCPGCFPDSYTLVGKGNNSDVRIVSAYATNSITAGRGRSGQGNVDRDLFSHTTSFMHASTTQSSTRGSRK